MKRRARERERDGKRAQIKQHGKLYENDEPHAQTKEKTTPKYVAKNANKIVSVCRHFGPAYIRDWSACVSFNLRTGKNAPLNAYTHAPTTKTVHRMHRIYGGHKLEKKVVWICKAIEIHRIKFEKFHSNIERTLHRCRCCRLHFLIMRVCARARARVVRSSR